MTLQFHPAARHLEAAVFYESRRQGLGAAFTIEVEATIGVCRTRTFPYGVVYSIEPDAIVIMAVMHLHREPGYWRQRTDSTKPPQK